jgi:hypothetical protein
MFTSLRQADGRRRNRPALHVEQLEARDCPAAPVLSAFSATMLGGHSVQLSGIVQSDHPSSTTVNFTGVASGFTNLQADGTFSMTTNANALGIVTAIATDYLLTSNPLTAQLASATPSATVNVAQHGGHSVTVSGQVTDDSLIGETVQLSGIVNASVMVNSDGSYSYTGQASGLGQVFATAQDVWGLKSASVAATVTNVAPVISNFTVINRGNGNWEFSGRVTDEFAPGMTVRISGLPGTGGSTSLGEDGDSSGGCLFVTVGAGGWFNVVANVGNIAGCMISADTIDGWGVASNTAYYLA